MNFNDLDFIIFFSVVLITLIILKNKKYQYLFLLFASYFFYYTFSNYYFLLLIYITIITYYTGKYIHSCEETNKRKLAVWIGIIASLSVLIYFKYTNFFLDNVYSLFHLNFSYRLVDVILPIGISFYTFSGLSYIIDIYLKKIKPSETFYKYALFVSFFPHLLAGPIVRASQFLPQLEQKIVIDPFNVKLGTTRIFWGLIKKFIIADTIAPFVNDGFTNPFGLSSFAVIKLAFLFGLQIYFDFSGYCDIALGLAQIIGLHLPENFDNPYFAVNPTLFWRKWNITLSSFIRDYVYIPLGGNRKGEIRKSLNLLFSMGLCGLWHGAAWNFVFWGIYHGILLNIHKFFMKANVKLNFLVNPTPANTIIKIVITQYFIFFGWLMFRLHNVNALIYCMNKYIFFDFNLTKIQVYAIILMSALLIVLIIMLTLEKPKKVLSSFYSRNWILSIASLKTRYWLIFISVSCFTYLCLLPEKAPEFIYFQF